MRTKEAWLIYDGMCPMCSNFARLYRINQSVKLHLIDARTDSQVLTKVTKAGLDLDQGMALILDDTIYHGVEASCVLASLGTKSNILNKFNYYIFRNKATARILYPILRLIRNLLLQIKGAPKINNLKQ